MKGRDWISGKNQRPNRRPMGRQGRLFSDAGQHLIVGSRSIEHEVILARRIYQQDQLHVIFFNKRVFIINDHLTLMWRWRIFKDIMRHYELIYMHLFFMVRHHAFDRHAIDTVHVRPRLWNQLLCAVPEISFEVLRNQLLWGIQMAYHSSPNHHSEKKRPKHPKMNTSMKSLWINYSFGTSPVFFWLSWCFCLQVSRTNAAIISSLVPKATICRSAPWASAAHRCHALPLRCVAAAARDLSQCHAKLPLPWLLLTQWTHGAWRCMERYGNIMGMSREYHQDIWEMEVLVIWENHRTFGGFSRQSLMTMQHFIGFWPQIAEVFCILGVTAMALWSISVESSGWTISTDGWKPMFWDVYHLSTGAGLTIYSI